MHACRKDTAASRRRRAWKSRSIGTSSPKPSGAARIASSSSCLTAFAAPHQVGEVAAGAALVEPQLSLAGVLRAVDESACAHLPQRDSKIC